MYQQKITIILLVILLSFLSVSNSFAQDNTKKMGKKVSVETRAAQIVEQMKKNLNLTDEQATKIIPIQEELVTQIRTIRQSFDRKQSKGQQIRDVNEWQEQELQKILDVQQFATYKANKKKAKAKQRERMMENRRKHRQNAQKHKTFQRNKNF